MEFLVAGVALWSGVHFLPNAGRALKNRIVDAIGENGYKIAFSLVVITAVALMVFGWRASAPEPVYEPPSWGPVATVVLMALALVLFTSARRPTALKRHVRHPQLLGIMTWALAHLLSNGDDRALVLFGGIGLWAFAATFAISAREGAWVKPEAPSLAVEIKGLVITAVVFVVLVLLHPYFAGPAIVAI